MAHIRKFLDLSSKHLSAEGKDFLRSTTVRETARIVPCAETWAGWFMYAEEGAELQLEVIPAHICIIMMHARKQGCEYVLFDQDGPEDPALPVFEE